MKNYVKRIRESYRKELNVIEVNDLPLVLMTEVINQSILRGATKITVSFDGTIMMVQDNAVPLEDDEFYIRDFLDASVVTDDGRVLGTVTDILESRNKVTSRARSSGLY